MSIEKTSFRTTSIASNVSDFFQWAEENLQSSDYFTSIVKVDNYIYMSLNGQASESEYNIAFAKGNVSQGTNIQIILKLENGASLSTSNTLTQSESTFEYAIKTDHGFFIYTSDAKFFITRINESVCCLVVISKFGTYYEAYPIDFTNDKQFHEWNAQSSGLTIIGDTYKLFGIRKAPLTVLTPIVFNSGVISENLCVAEFCEDPLYTQYGSISLNNQAWYFYRGIALKG